MPRTNRYKVLRLKSGKTVAEAAKLYGCGVSMVYMIESGQREPSRELGKRMCTALSCTADELLGLQKNPRY